MNDYKKLNATHHLASYEVSLPVWNGRSGVRTPFAAWNAGAQLPWYAAYNATKHDRRAIFHHANFEQTLDAVAGLLVLLSAQFHTDDFAPVSYLKTRSGENYDGTDVGIGGYFQVRFPTDWPPENRYDFHWQLIMNEPDPFDQLTFA
jgi:hypothetical protein